MLVDEISIGGLRSPVEEAGKSQTNGLMFAVDLLTF
jgi:hypothetical protein